MKRLALIQISTLVLILVLVTLLPTTTVHAATITVTSQLDTVDAGHCRLRDAIIAANTNTATGDCTAGTSGLDTIDFSLGPSCSVTPCTITLTGPLPTVTENLTIDGNSTILDGANSFQVFLLGAVTVTMSNLSIENGNAPMTGGGAIEMSFSGNTVLTISHMSFSNNHARYGGAIDEPLGTLTIDHSSFSGNSSVFEGGAIDEETDSDLIVVADSSFNANTAESEGGAIALGSAVDISNTSFSGNSADTGGAIVKTAAGNLNIHETVFDHNNSTGTGPASGGGAIKISPASGTQTLTNVTVSSNLAKNNGGGIFFNQTSTSLNNVTIAENTADSENDGTGDGGGIFSNSGTVQVQNSIIAGNFDTPGNAGGGTKNTDCSGTFSSQGHNLIGTHDGCLGFVNGVNADKVGSFAQPLKPRLAALANNGGPTQTQALLPGSPAVDGGSPLTPGSGGQACALIDQRSIGRPLGNRCDSGAFETAEFPTVYLPLLHR